MDPVTVSLNAPVAAETAISDAMFGANYVYDYERIGDLPWARFDEIVDLMGAPQLRYPGGNAIETSFNYMDPDSPVDLAGRAVMGLSDFVAFAGTRGIEPVILLPNKPFICNETHQMVVWDEGTGGWALDPSAVAAAKAVIENIVNTALDAAQAAGIGIAAFEIGNEYPGVTYIGDDGQTYHMSGTQYGIIANEMAQWVDAAIAAHASATDPQVLVQVWGDYNHDGVGPDALDVSNNRVLAEFDADGFAAIDGTTNHIYFREGKTTIDGLDSHSYETLDDRIAEMAAMSELWRVASGKDLDLHITEWNVQKTTVHEPTYGEWQANNRTWTVTEDWIETAHFGMKQLAPLLEMVAAFNVAGADSAQIWSVMYNAAAMGVQDDGGRLTAPGTLMALMTDLLPGTRYLEVDAESTDADVHVFSGAGQTHVFVSSRSDMERVFDVDLAALASEDQDVSVRYIRPDASTSDGQFTQDGNTYLTGDALWVEADIAATVTSGVDSLVDSSIALTLGAYEVALISFSNTGWNYITGSSATESLTGTALDDRILGLDGADYIRGEDGSDWIEGGADDDAIYGGAGEDRLDGGDGNDYLQGGAGSYADEILGGAGDDIAFGGAGMDRLYGGHGHDVLQGDSSRDVLRGQKGRDTLLGGSGSDLLHGASSRDVLDGGDGNDMLRGDGGNDRLIGGDGKDRFVFRIDQRSGHDRILDFAPGVDVVEFRGADEDAMDRLTLTQMGEHLEITWDLGSVRLLDTTLDDLQDGDISFV